MMSKIMRLEELPFDVQIEIEELGFEMQQAENRRDEEAYDSAVAAYLAVVHLWVPEGVELV